jgi:hypothetical protein
MSTYGKNFYASLIVGLESAAPAMFLALCTTTPSASDSGATIAEAATGRVLLVPGSGSWSTPTSGLTDYVHDFEYVLTDSDDWGTVNGYAICDSATTGTGNVLFYGSFSPFETNYQSIFVTISGISILVGEQ